MNREDYSYFAEDTLVYTSKGNKYIKDIEVGDYVLTNSGIFHPVLEIDKYDTNKVCKLRSYGSYNITTTDSALFPTKSKAIKDRYVPAEDITASELEVGQFLCSLTPKESNLNQEINKEILDLFSSENSFYDFISLFLFKGAIVNNIFKNGKTQKKILIYSSRTEENKIKEILDNTGIKYRVLYPKHSNTLTIIIQNIKLFNYLISNFGEKKINFHFNEDLVLLNGHSKKMLFYKIQKMFDQYDKETDVYIFNFHNPKILYDMKQLFMENLEYPIKINLKKSSESNVHGKKFLKKDLFLLKYKNNFSKYDHAIKEQNTYWQPIRSIKDYEYENPITVYSLHVDIDNSFVVNSILTKNKVL